MPPVDGRMHVNYIYIKFVKYVRKAHSLWRRRSPQDVRRYREGREDCDGDDRSEGRTLCSRRDTAHRRSRRTVA